MDGTQQIERLIAPQLTALGYELVRVVIIGGKHPSLQIMIERADQEPMTVEDCATASRALSAVLDVEDPMVGSYLLEVSSPGIDRPLTRLSDYQRFVGHEAKIEVRETVGGRRRFRGLLHGVEGQEVRVATPEGPVSILFDNVLRAKLVLTDALVAAGSGAAKA
ncbi:Ribosome maturation factor RimP [uncultured Gammaproteobacteria bacterium]